MDIEPLRLPFDATIRLPGSKSHANRAIVAACLAKGHTALRDATPSDDVRLLVENLQRLGFRLEWLDEEQGVLVVDGGLPQGPAPTVPTVLDCGLGGTTLRFLVAVASLVPGEWIVTGNARMRERPVGALVEAMQSLGVTIEATAGCPPVRVHGGHRRGGTVALDASQSSQFLSALMLIAPALEGGLRIELTGPTTSPSYVELTRRVLGDFACAVGLDGRALTIPGDGLRSSGDLRIEGDWSAAGVWLALADATRSRFRAENLAASSAQGDRLMPLQLALLRREGDVELDVTDTPDQTMNLAVAAALRDGTTTITGAANLRRKECDRLAVTVAALRAVGVTADELPDGLRIQGASGLRGAALRCHGDHRMAMAFAILGCVAPGISIDDPDCVTKSYPRFFDDLRAARRSPRCIALVGMRGAGKSTLARALAAELGCDALDTDAEFEKQRGPVTEFVSRSGWEAFRGLESGILADALAPGRVVAVGGGALERPGNVDLVRGKALVVWIGEEAETLIARLRHDERPRLTELPLEDEVRTVLARRQPVFASVADFALAPGGSVDERVAAIADWLRAPFRRGLAVGTASTPR